MAYLFAARKDDGRSELDAIAHDLNNLLTAISGYASRLVANGAATPSVQRDAAAIDDAAARAVPLVRQLHRL